VKIAVLACLLLSGCRPVSPADPRVHNGGATEEMALGGGSLLHWRTVTIEGNDYLLTYSGGGYSLCPKLPPKAERNERTTREVQP